MTTEGHQTLQEELRNLKSVERPNIVKAIAAAREHGDLSENAEYHAARERQSFIEGRIGELEDAIKRAEVIDTSKLKGKVVRFGATVKVADEETDEEITYQLVGELEADIQQRKISIGSPLGRALI
jgi:transcription elongation factor GreA